MNIGRWVDPRVRDVRVADLEAYLRRLGWVNKPTPIVNALRYDSPAGLGAPPYLLVPVAEHFTDYVQRVIELITLLSEVEERHPVEVLNDILTTVAEDGSPTSGSGRPSATRKRR
jgi:hypothetical protein